VVDHGSLVVDHGSLVVDQGLIVENWRVQNLDYITFC
jgi:hypothetical protein